MDIMFQEWWTNKRGSAMFDGRRVGREIVIYELLKTAVTLNNIDTTLYSILSILLKY